MESRLWINNRNIPSRFRKGWTLGVEVGVGVKLEEEASNEGPSMTVLFWPSQLWGLLSHFPIFVRSSPPFGKYDPFYGRV